MPIDEWRQPVEDRFALAYIAVCGARADSERFVAEAPGLKLAGG